MSRLPRLQSPAPVFEHRTTEPDLHPSVIRGARKTGQLNMASKGLVAVPEQVWRMNSISLEETKRLSQSWDTSNADDKWWDKVALTKLNLSSNRIAEISRNVSMLSSLVSLDLHDNMIAELPDEIGDLINLTHINLRRNRLRDLPSQFFQLRDLRVLSLGQNSLCRLDDDIGNLSLLEELDLSGNQLTCLPATLGFLSRTSKLNLSENHIEELPPDMGAMTNLQSVDLAHNKLKTIPASFGDLRRLARLDMRHNDLEQLPPLDNCEELKELYVGNNYLKELSPGFMEAFCKLKVLDLRDNKLSSLPEELVLIHGLERLDLTNNDLNNLPAGMGTMTNLKSLSLEGNPLRSIRRDVLQRGTVQLMKFLRNRMGDESSDGGPSASMDSAVKRRSFVENLNEIDVFTIRKTRCLDCSGRQVDTIPDDLFSKAAEAEATVVNLGKNQLTEIPRSIAVALPHLTELIITSNKIKAIPPCIREARCLQYLDASQNRLSELPGEMRSLTNLREIWLSGNGFRRLPPVLYDLVKLEIILASDNSIESIDVTHLSRLKVLTSLNLQNNSIATVPPELGTLRQLRSLQLEGNPFRHPRPAVLSKGTMALMEYLRDRIPR